MITAFIDLNFHIEETKSSQFFIDICKDHFDKFYLIGANEAWYEIPRLKPDTIIMWQAIFEPEEIDSWKAKNIIIIPMFDAVPMNEDFWNKYKSYKIFCFCKKLFNFLSERGFNTFYNQYYIKPTFTNTNTIENKTDLPALFFWERSKLVNWPLISKLINTNNIKSIHYHYSTNITEKNTLKPTYEEIKKYNITFSDWFNTQDEYKKILNSTDIYFAPREKEGIGLSFIEAIAAGCVVAGYNDSTMNEYIDNNENGFLFSSNTTQTLDLSTENIQKLQKASKQKALEGFEKWSKTLPNVMKFFDDKMERYTPRIHLKTYIFKRLKAEVRYIYKKIKK